ncbi:general odorant-binding protein 45-like [Toxorhynchites rutilus septentrionalis]|uniref:general odorant-binding protein 45-like n=1 Tax=Toxorhynchites rutilus septentrionalis TaxID=329112 RepID=UPI00247A5CFC|nr:general odorant-binding protein 45-like [Toxorhynchites rutilus septentrionalis]
MKLLVGLLVATVASTVSAGPYPFEVEESHFAYQLKSFRQSLDECAEYLEVPPEVVDRFVARNFVTNERDLKCLIRCAGINSGWWSDGSGVQTPVIESYFQPACGDIAYRRRTKECGVSKLAVCQDDCSKAYETFLCYYHQYGNLKCSEEYIPLTHLEAVQAAIDCLNVLQVPIDLLEQYCAGVIPDVPMTHCIYRCQYLAEGLYDTAYGFNLTRFYIRHHDYPSLEYLSDNTKACTEVALRENCDECTRVYRARRCFSGCNPNSVHTANILKHAAEHMLRGDAVESAGPYNNALIKLPAPKPSVPVPSPYPAYLPPKPACGYCNNSPPKGGCKYCQA